jgi:hypothetical protein
MASQSQKQLKQPNQLFANPGVPMANFAGTNIGGLSMGGSQ